MTEGCVLITYETPEAATQAQQAQPWVLGLFCLWGRGSARSAAQNRLFLGCCLAGAV